MDLAWLDERVDDIDSILLADRHVAGDASAPAAEYLVVASAPSISAAVRLYANAPFALVRWTSGESLRALRDSFDASSSWLWQAGNSARAQILGEEQLRLAHDVTFGAVIHAGPLLARYRAAFAASLREDNTVVMGCARHYSAREDAIAQARLGDTACAVHMMRRGMALLGMAALASVGVCEPRQKWLLLRLRRAEGRLGSVSARRFAALLCEWPQQPVIDYVRDAAAFADAEIMRILHRRKRLLPLFALLAERARTVSAV